MEMNIYEINKNLFQRPPLQMIDRVLEMRGGEYGKALKNLSVNEPFFQGHFPGFPIMPGVLIVESAAQLCALIMATGELEENKLPVLLKIDTMKFIKPAIPGDTLIIEAVNTQNMENFAKFDITVMVNDQKISKGVLMFSFLDKNTI